MSNRARRLGGYKEGVGDETQAYVNLKKKVDHLNNMYEALGKGNANFGVSLPQGKKIPQEQGA